MDEVRITPMGFVAELFRRYKSQIMLSVIAVTMILVGSFETPEVNVFEHPDFISSADFKAFVGGLILVLFGLAGICTIPLRNGTFPAGLMTLGVVIHYVFFVMFLFPDTSEDDDVSYMIRLAFYVLLGFCGLFSLKIIIGSTQNTMRIVVVEIAFLAVFAIAYLLGIHHGLTPSESIASLKDYHGTFFIMLVSVICLNLSDSKYIGPMKRVRMNVEALETTTVTNNDTYIMRESLYLLMDPDREGWSASDEPGVEKELIVNLYNRLRREQMVIRKWEGEESPICTFMPLDLKVHLYKHLNIPIRTAVCPGGIDNCRRVRFYGDNGYFVDILVRDTHIRKYKTDTAVSNLINWKKG